MANFNPTLEQQNALIQSDIGQTMKLIAYAGAGKTATLVMVAERLQQYNKRGIYLAFNKAIANEAGRKLPNRCNARTFHSLALGATPNNIKSKIAFKAYKTPQGFKKLDIHSFTQHIAPELEDLVITGKSIIKDEVIEKQVKKSKQFKLVKRALNDAFMRDDTLEPELKHVTRWVKKELGLEIEQTYLLEFTAPLLEYARTIWADYQNPNGIFSIGHDVYLKLYAMSNPIINTDYILFDEAQDADPLMLHVLKQQKAQVIYVGDPHQQIYEWRGAVNAMQDIDAPYSYLTKSFRFGEAVGNVANTFLNYLNEKNPLRHNELVNSALIPLPFNDADVVLCRTNSGAIEACLEAMDSVRNISLEISSVKQVKELIEDIDGFTRNPQQYRDHFLLGEFENLTELAEYCNNGEDANPDIVRPFKLYMKYGYQSLMRVFSTCKRSNNADLTIMTVHGSKGREWDDVKIHDDFEGISYSLKYDKESGKVVGFSTSDGEVRLMYVAVTRAKFRLDIEGISVAIEHIRDNDAKNYELSQPDDTARHIEPPKQPKQNDSERKRQQKAHEGQLRAIAQGREFGRPKIPIDKYLDKYSEVVEAVETGGFTNKEIATLTGASVATIKRVKSKLKKAKAKV